MKIDRHCRRVLWERVKLTRRSFTAIAAVVLTCWLNSLPGTVAIAQQRGETPSKTSPAALTADAQEASDPQASDPQASDPRAVGLLNQVLKMLVHGPPFHAKIRETVWTHGREVVGVGTYEQAGEGSGRFNLQLTMHDGDGKHRLQQISDGRLAWTRTEIAGSVSLRRVDVSRLDEWVNPTVADLPVAPRFTVGAWTELLTNIQRDHVLSVVGAKLETEPVWVLKGQLRTDRRAQVLAESGRTEWPKLYPTRVHVAIRSKSDPSSGIGELLPVRLEFWSDPLAADTSDSSSKKASPKDENAARLITLIELYSIQPIAPPPAERFRFENQDSEVNFVNETDRYIQFFGVHLSERERRQLRR